MALEEDITAFLVQKLPEVVGIYLFGSFAKCESNAKSDIDIAVLPSKKLDSLFRFELAEAIALLAKRDVDLIDLLSASTVFRFQILHTGKRIYCKNHFACELFETTAFSAYVRFNEERKDILKDIEQRGSIF